jgi:hypothetical protein
MLPDRIDDFLPFDFGGSRLVEQGMKGVVAVAVQQQGAGLRTQARPGSPQTAKTGPQDFNPDILRMHRNDAFVDGSLNTNPFFVERKFFRYNAVDESHFAYPV